MIFLGIFRHRRIVSNSDQEIPSAVDWPDYVVSLDKKKFEQFIKRYALSAVDFWAPWCNPCKAMVPRLRKLSKIYQGKVAFGKLNIQENQDIAKKYKIMGIPNLIFFRYGKKINNITGVKSVGNIKNVIEDLLKNKNGY